VWEQETTKSKKKVAADPGVDWTATLIRFILEQRDQLHQILANPGLVVKGQCHEMELILYDVSK
jgi:hypothetical protein